MFCFGASSEAAVANAGVDVIVRVRVGEGGAKKRPDGILVRLAAVRGCMVGGVIGNRECKAW